MENNDLQYCFNIYSPGSFLWWLTIICFLGALITGVGLNEINKFMVDINGAPVSMMRLQRTWSVLKINERFSKLTDQGFAVIHKHLVVDFFFMPFLYVLMSCIAIIILRNTTAGTPWNQLLSYLSILPVIIWLLDVIENVKTLGVIKDYRSSVTNVSKTQLFIMSVSSLLKWITGALWLFFILAYLTAFLVERYF